jgi:hypothetical protein
LWHHVPFESAQAHAARAAMAWRFEGPFTIIGSIIVILEKIVEIASIRKIVRNPRSPNGCTSSLSWGESAPILGSRPPDHRLTPAFARQEVGLERTKEPPL